MRIKAPTGESPRELKDFCDSVSKVLNGNVALPGIETPSATKKTDLNIDGVYVFTQFPVAPDTDNVIIHNLNRLPSGYIVVRQDRSGSVYVNTISSWTKTTITLRCGVASLTAHLIIF